MRKLKYIPPHINSVETDWDIVLMATSPNYSGDEEIFFARKRKIEPVTHIPAPSQDETSGIFDSHPFAQAIDWQ